MMSIKIIIVDDHTLFRKGLTLILNQNNKFKVIAEASDGTDFIKLLNNHHPDIVFMDIRMPNMNGYDATQLALKKRPDLKVIALSMLNEEEHLEKMLKSGVKGFLLKESSTNELFKAIDIVYAGGSYFSPDIMKVLSKKITPAHEKETVKLNKREKEIIHFLSQGLSTLEIVEKLHLSPRTIETYRTNLLQKTNSKNTISLVLYAIKHNLAELK